MSTQRLNAPEKELEKFIKFLALKSTQVVVQSRLGEKIQTQCNPLATGEHWYNIDIEDHPVVSAETKRALSLGPGESILQRLPLCVEISLKTVDGDQMVLEVWSLDVQQPKDKEEKMENGGKGENGKVTINIVNSNSAVSEQQTLKTAHTIYNRMGILLKSLITLTRAIPAYKLSRRQCADSYGIYYRIYVDRPQVHALGEGYKNVKIGQLNTIVGALSMSVAYRTKMTITPTSTVQVRAGDGKIMVKSDHFRPSNGSPTQHNHCTTGLKRGSGGSGGTGDRKMIDIDKPLRPGAFTDVGKIKQYTDFVLPETPPFEWLLRRTRCESACSGGAGCGSVESLNRKSESPVAAVPLSNGHKHNINNNTNLSNVNIYSSNNNNVTAFKNFENEENARKSPAPSAALSQSPIKSLFVPVPSAIRHGSAPTLQPAVHSPPDDDNLLKELNFPFASPTSHVNDLAKFYRDCYHAPPLRGLSEIQTEAAGCGATAIAISNGAGRSVAIDDLSRQLEQFETSLEDYDKLVSQLGLSTSSSTGSRSSGGLQMSN